MIRTFRYRLYPHARQSKKMHYLLWLARNVYNSALEQRITTYQETGFGITCFEQSKHFGRLRRIDPDGIGLLNCNCMGLTLRRLDKAYKAFFRRVKSGGAPGFPRFKSKKRWRSIEFTHGNGCKLKFDDGGRALLYLQNVGEVKIKYHRDIPDGKIKHVILKRWFGKWYVLFQVDLPEPEIVGRDENSVGIDMGLHSLLALSDGKFVENPRWLRGSLKELRIAQRRVSRRKRGSAGRRRARYQVAKLHDHISNQRRDFWHKTTRDLVNTYSLIAIEDLNLKFMTVNHHLALSAHDAGLGIFRQLLVSKAEEAGSLVVTVNPYNTTQMCSGCGEIAKKDLSARTHSCPYCGLVLDRDTNAAINIINLAIKSARTEPPGDNADHGIKRSPGSLLLKYGESSP